MLQYTRIWWACGNFIKVMCHAARPPIIKFKWKWDNENINWHKYFFGLF